MRDLIDRFYMAIQQRGLINKETTSHDFMAKLREEMAEVEVEWRKAIFINNIDDPDDPFYDEIVDVIGVCINLLTYCDIDFIEAFEKCVNRNEKRAIEGN